MNSNKLYTCDINDINEFLPIYYIIVVHQWRIVWNYIYIYIYIITIKIYYQYYILHLKT